MDGQSDVELLHCGSPSPLSYRSVVSLPFARTIVMVLMVQYFRGQLA